MKRVAIATLGCKTNQFESAAMIEQFTDSGYSVVPFSEVADIYVVNSCTVTARTDTETRRLIRRARRLNPQARIVATGCYAQVAPQELEQMPEVDTVLGNREKSAIASLTEAGENRISDIGSEATAIPLKLESFAEHTRAFLQIQNGCNAFCSYCIVPYARGRSRSVVPAHITTEIEKLAANGYREIVLTGIHLGAYGHDLTPPTSLLELLQAITAQAAIPRLRIGSLEPNELDRPLIELIRDSAMLCHHLHLPLQSGSDSVLKRMGRHYTSEQFRLLVEEIQRELPDAYIAADVIAGFPGENEAEFDATMALIKELPLSDLHVFPYSKRSGTKAAGMEGHLPASVITGRAKLLRELAAAKKQQFLGQQIGQTLQVLVQQIDQHGICSGISRNYVTVMFQGEREMINSEQTVLITELRAEKLSGKIIDSRHEPTLHSSSR